MQLRVKLGTLVPIRGGTPNVGIPRAQPATGNQTDVRQGWLTLITTNPQAQIKSL